MAFSDKYFFGFLLVAFLFFLLRLSREPIYRLPADRPISYRARITSQPYLKGSKQIMKTGPVWVIADRFPEYLYGQKIKVTGTLQRQASTFSQSEYWAYFPTIEMIESASERSPAAIWRRRLEKIRLGLEKPLKAYFPEPAAGLMGGIVWGAKQGLGQEFSQILRKTGTIHAVVASGQNISLLTYLLMAGLTLWWGRRQAIVVAGLLVWLYVALAGGEAPVIRAALMAMVVFTAQAIGREAKVGRVLLLVALVMLVWRPTLIFDLGFQLSFAATAGLVYLNPLLKKVSLLGGQSFWSEALRSTLAAQAAVTPLLLTQFGQISWLSPLVNGLVIWTVPPLMVLGVVTSLLGSVSQIFGQLTAWLAWPLLTYFIKVVEFFGRLPVGVWQVEHLSPLWVILYYLLLLGLVWRGNRDE